MICLQLCEATNINVLFPFLAFMVEHFGYGGHQLGYYAGFLAASFCGAQLTSSIFWGMISDKYGRKPAVVFGTFGAGIGMLVFGMATTYKQAVLGRLLSGFLSGNIGIIKSFLTEITDNTNRAKGFSYLQVAWAMGSILGPLIGGFLCYPSTKYSNIFPSGSIFDHRPFFLPCLVCVIQNIFSTIIVIAFMKEPQRKNKQIKKIESSNRGISSGKDGIESRQSFTQSVSNNLAYALSSIKSTWSAVVSYLLEREDEGIEYSPVSLDASVHNAVSRAGQQGSTDASEYNDDMDVSTHKDNDIQSSKDEGEMEMIRLDDSTISDMDSSSHPIIFDSSTSNDKNGLRRQRSDSSSSHTNSKSVLLDRDVLLTVGCYGILSFGDVITVECIPLLCKLDRSLGGLSLGSSDIGLAMSVGGVSMLIFSSLLLPKILSGSKLQVFRIFNLIGIPVILLFPSLGIICNFLTDGFNLQSEENKYKVLMILLTCAVTIRTLVFTLSFSSVSCYLKNIYLYLFFI